ncbi:MAG: hypothetical protein NC340_04960 [Ruminococcus flavefaciens]|nr:hypothetical protein [Ruminococcus flavefaciens]MCM1228985.1 hypothetical protein [Ruminococcus flavefaciens]
MKIRNIILALSLCAMLCGCAESAEPVESESVMSVPEYRTITIDDLTELNGNNLKIEYNSDGRIGMIDGEFAYFPVTDRYTAYEAFLGIAEFLDIANAETDFRFDESASRENTEGIVTDLYQFSQYYEGIKVLGANVRIIVNREHTERIDIHSSYEPDLNLDTEPKIARDDAVKIVADNYNSDVYGEPELVIYEKKLAWDMSLTASDVSRVIINANNGTVLYKEEEIVD